jgi:hypothetical protein
MNDFQTISDGPCTFTHEGHEYTNGGAYLGVCTDGLVRGTAYLVPVPHVPGSRPWTTNYHITTWRGQRLGPAYLGPKYRGNFGDERRSVSAKINGVALYGTLCGDTQLVRLTQYKNPPDYLSRVHA